MKKLFFCLFICYFSSSLFSQDYFGYGGSNYGGLHYAFSNPAAVADNRLKYDFIFTGIDFTFNNSWFGVKREALKYTGSVLNPKSIKLPVTWKNQTPDVADNVFKNFVPIVDPKYRNAVVESRIMLPSFMFHFNQKNSFAFAWSIRQFANVDGLNRDFTNLFEHEMNWSVLQNHNIQNKNISGVQMSWVEYGFTYARVMMDKQKHFLKVGVTPKLLQGLESVYLSVKDLNFYFSTKDSSTYFNNNFSYAHSANFKLAKVSDIYHWITKPALGLDLGLVYEWRPDFQNFKYKPDGKNNLWRKDANKYKLKFGASLMDVGKIKFNKDGKNYDLDVHVQGNIFTKYSKIKNVEMFDSLLQHDFSSKNKTSSYTILLPTALNLQADYCINRLYYLNLSAHIANFYGTDELNVHNYTSICFSPRMEHYWYDVSFPFSFNALSSARFRYIMSGINIRLGPVMFGSNDVFPLFNGDVKGINFYAMLKLSIPYKRIKDVDKDGVKDWKDKCPIDSGVILLSGCPDIDNDKVPDKDDECPLIAGVENLKGCPDADGDGIKDSEDLCPDEKGPLYMKGCPDADGDSITDKIDLCPHQKGIKKFSGCADTDGDGISDKDDLCPTMKGPAKFKGCTDKDNDGVHDGIDHCPFVAGPSENQGCPWKDTNRDGVPDRIDSCVNVAGVPELKGCPQPLKLALREKKILQRAYSNLEFAPDKDIIKPSSFPYLMALAKMLLHHQYDWKIKLTGHTDNNGTEKSNLILSEKRARAVQDYLIKYGLPKENIHTEWFGQSKPIASNKTKAGRRKNRRVEMLVLLRE